MTLDRREALERLLGALAIAAGVAGPRLASGVELHEAAGGVLAPHELESVSAIADKILPATDTAGAADARVERFVDAWLATQDAGVRAAFTSGLAAFERRCLAAKGALFHRLDDAGQDALIAALAADGGGGFFETIRFLTVFGYYTSKPGMEQELGWKAIPGEYAGCTHPEHRK